MFDILTKLVNQTDRAPLKLMTQIKTVKKLTRSLKNFVAELHPPYDWTLPLLSGVKPESGMISSLSFCWNTPCYNTINETRVHCLGRLVITAPQNIAACVFNVCFRTFEAVCGSACPVGQLTTKCRQFIVFRSFATGKNLLHLCFLLF